MSKLIKQFIFLLFVVPVVSSVDAQSISGNVSSFESESTLGYATVDIYKGKELVASVLTNDAGVFNVKLDTGTYKAIINYAGYKSIEQTIKVTDDEEVDFGLKRDERSKYKPARESEKYIAEEEEYESAPEMIMSRSLGAAGDGFSYRGKKAMSRPTGVLLPIKEEQGEAGRLTAGEINDFSKWGLWNDLKDTELTDHKLAWNIDPTDRYSVHITDQNSLPLADIVVYLKTKEGETVFRARTDNTGKAELWGALTKEADLRSKKMEIEIFYNGQSHLIKRPKKIWQGSNHKQINTQCDQSQKVDIAFVVDATGSMSDELNFLTAEVNDVMYKAKQISTSLNFSFANVFYRDEGDDYVTRKQDFTRVLSESVSFVTEQRAGGGGDFPEAVEVALDTAINGLNWSKTARARIVFLILDAPPHNTIEIQEKLRKISAQAAEKGIRIVPLVASGIDKATEYLMRSIALTTNGTYAFLTGHSGIGNDHLEPSTDSYKVELLNDLLVRVIKSYTYMPDCDQQIPDLNLNYPDSLVIMDTTENRDSVSNEIPPVISWRYYPNPTTGIVNIVASVSIEELYISDLSGKVIQTISDIKANNTVQVNLSQYASGIYLIRYPVGKQWLSGKVILLR